jgi:hypothetical protein
MTRSNSFFLPHIHKAQLRLDNRQGLNFLFSKERANSQLRICTIQTQNACAGRFRVFLSDVLNKHLISNNNQLLFTIRLTISERRVCGLRFYQSVGLLLLLRYPLLF